MKWVDVCRRLLADVEAANHLSAQVAHVAEHALVPCVLILVGALLFPVWSDTASVSELAVIGLTPVFLQGALLLLERCRTWDKLALIAARRLERSRHGR